MLGRQAGSKVMCYLHATLEELIRTPEARLLLSLPLFSPAKLDNFLLRKDNNPWVGTRELLSRGRRIKSLCVVIPKTGVLGEISITQNAPVSAFEPPLSSRLLVFLFQSHPSFFFTLTPGDCFPNQAVKLKRG